MIQQFLAFFNHTWFFTNLIQILILLFFTVLFYNRFIKNSPSKKIIHGIFWLIVLWVLSFVWFAIGLNILGYFSRMFALFLSVGLVVVFQPELRKFFALMGNINLWNVFVSQKKFNDTRENALHKHVAEEIVKSVQYLSKNHTGALLVFQNNRDGTSGGIEIDGVVSSELLLTLFFNKTPLHDGAVLISNGRIARAGTILPLTKQLELEWKYGTRHRAALGQSEINPESCVLVVSEETGDVSVAQKGKIKKIESYEKLRQKVMEIL